MKAASSALPRLTGYQASNTVNARVRNIANYGLQDGRVFDFVTRTTPSGAMAKSQRITSSGTMIGSRFERRTMRAKR